MRIVLLREIPEEPSLMKSWNDLVLEMERPQVFYTCQWAQAIQGAFKSAFKPPPKPLLFLGYDGDQLVGVGSLATDLGEQNVSFMAGTTADYCEFLSHPLRREEFTEGIFAELRRLKMGDLSFANLPADSATSDALQAAARKHGFHVYIRPAYLCPQVELGLGEQREQLKTTVMRKRQLRKCLRDLERKGRVTSTFVRSWTEIKTALPGFVSAHVARFHAVGRASFLLAPERRFLLEELASRFSDTGVVTLSRLMIEDRPVAWSYGFQFNGSWFLYQTTFDTTYEENSPGYCLLGKILIEACEKSHLRLVDLGLGSEGYKEWFANGTRQTLHATLTTSPVRHLRGIARHRVATEVKSYPKLEAAIRNARSRFGL